MQAQNRADVILTVLVLPDNLLIVSFAQEGEGNAVGASDGSMTYGMYFSFAS